MAEAAREQIEIVVTTKGLDEADRSTGKLYSSLDKLDGAQGKVAASADRGNAAQERAAAARARMDAALEKANRQMEASARLMALQQQAADYASSALSRAAAAQAEHARAASLSAAAANDNAKAMDGTTASAGLLTRALALVFPALGPAATAIGAFTLLSTVVDKASGDLQKLIELGERSRKLDIAAPFVKSFEELGTKIGATDQEMTAALQRASSFVKDQWGQYNQLKAAIGDINSTGIAGPDGLKATTQADLASNNAERIQAALAAMKELDGLGQHVAAMDLGAKVFGQEFIERLRVGNTSFSEMAAKLDEIAQKEVLKQEQVDKALALNKQIAEVKQGISDALAVNLDFTAVGYKLNEVWLYILQTVKSVIDSINAGIEAASNFATTLATTIYQKVAGFLAPINALLEKVGVLSASQPATAPPAAPVVTAPTEPKIGARQFPYTFGPELPQATQALKQHGAAAQETASSIELLTKRTQDHIAELDLEARSVGQSTAAVTKLKLQHDLERAALKDGVEVTDAMRESWDKLGDKLAESTVRLAESRRAFDLMKEGQRELADGFTDMVSDIVTGGRRMDEAFANLSKTLANDALKALMSGQGPLAGVLGTASPERGGLGGVLGGQINFNGLFGTAEQAPLPGAQGPTLPASGLRSLFDSDRFADALGLGAETGLGRAITGWLKEQKAGGGLMSSQFGQGLAAVGTGAAVGFSSQSPIMGGISGLLAGAMTGNPLLAAAGPAIGLGGTFGKRRTANDNPQPETQEPPRDGDQRPLAA